MQLVDRVVERPGVRHQLGARPRRRRRDRPARRAGTSCSSRKYTGGGRCTPADDEPSPPGAGAAGAVVGSARRCAAGAGFACWYAQMNRRRRDPLLHARAVGARAGASPPREGPARGDRRGTTVCRSCASVKASGARSATARRSDSADASSLSRTGEAASRAATPEVHAHNSRQAGRAAKFLHSSAHATITRQTSMLGTIARIPMPPSSLVEGVVLSTVQDDLSRVVQRFVERRKEAARRRNGTFAAFGCFYLGGVQYMIYVPFFQRIFPHGEGVHRAAVREEDDRLRGAADGRVPGLFEGSSTAPAIAFARLLHVKASSTAGRSPVTIGLSSTRRRHLGSPRRVRRN